MTKITNKTIKKYQSRTTNSTLEKVWDKTIKDLDLKDLPAINNYLGSCDALIIKDEKVGAVTQSKEVEEEIKENQRKGYKTEFDEYGTITQYYPDGGGFEWNTPLAFYQSKLKNIDWRMNIEQGNLELRGYNRAKRVKTRNNFVSKAFNKNLKVMIKDLNPEFFI